MTTATKSPATEKIGGQYDWELGADGKYTIKNIEIFSAHAFGENGVDYDVTDEWVDRACAKLVENFPKHPIAVNYSFKHDPATKKLLGFLRPNPNTRRVKVNGKIRNTMFGDVIGVEAADFKDFQDKKYPYRSASIISLSKHRFRDVSMMQEPGFYEYPILTLEEKAVAQPEASPLIAYHAVADDQADFLYAFGANDKKKSKKSDGKKKDDGDSKKSGFGGDEKSGGDEDEDASADGEDGEEAGLEGEDGEKPQPESMTDGMSLEEKIDKVLACVLQLMKDSVPSEDEVNGNKAPSQDTGASKKTYSAKEDHVSTEPKKDDAAAKTAATSAETKTAIQDDAKYSALEDRTAKLEKKISAKESAEKTVIELEAEGYNLTSKTKERIANYAAKGEEHLKDFVDTYKTYADKDPQSSAEGGATGTGSGAAAPAKTSGLPTDVAEYAAKNPADKAGISLRAKLFPEFEMYKKQGGAITSFERFVQSELDADASQMKLVASE